VSHIAPLPLWVATGARSTIGHTSRHAYHSFSLLTKRTVFLEDIFKQPELSLSRTSGTVVKMKQWHPDFGHCELREVIFFFGSLLMVGSAPVDGSDPFVFRVGVRGGLGVRRYGREC
jgi:hypothetical protein